MVCVCVRLCLCLNDDDDDGGNDNEDGDVNVVVQNSLTKATGSLLRSQWEMTDSALFVAISGAPGLSTTHSSQCRTNP